MTPELLRDMPKERLIAIILNQAKAIEQMRVTIKELEKRIEELERESHRQAAPFRIRERKKVAHPERPGRKIGHKGFYRQKPDYIDEIIEVPLTFCPLCKGNIHDVEKVTQYIEEIPEVRPKVYHLTTYKGQCDKCGEVSSTHPLKVSHGTGAAAVQIGPGTLSAAVKLQYEYGLSKRKTCRILNDFFGLSLTAGGLVQASHRVGKKCDVDYLHLKQEVQSSSVIHSDETSWYVGNPKNWLWVFTNASNTLYKVDGSRGREVIHSTLGKEYKGVLVSDCLSIYDNVNTLQQKCYSHHLKAISQAIEKNTTSYLLEIKTMLKAAMYLHKSKEEIQHKKYVKCRNALEQKADAMLFSSRADPVEEKIANRLRKQRDHLFTFLYYAGVDPTNNLAERQLRPAVIARKVSCGNKTRKGADTWEICTSLLATHKQRGIDSYQYFRQKIGSHQ